MAMSHRRDSLLEKRVEEQEKYIGTRDYQVIKASRLGKSVDQVYPGHTSWYSKEMEKLQDLEEQLKKSSPEAWERILYRRNHGKPE